VRRHGDVAAVRPHRSGLGARHAQPVPARPRRAVVAQRLLPAGSGNDPAGREPVRAAARGCPSWPAGRAVRHGRAGAGRCGDRRQCWLPAYTPLLAPLVHGLSAQMAFLCVTVAMLVQAWCFGRDARWRRWHRPAWWWAWLTFAPLWGHVL